MLNELTYTQEIFRKLIHISSSFIAILLWYFGKSILIPWILLFAILFPIMDYSRKYITQLQYVHYYIFSNVTRPYEKHNLSGASWVFIGAGLTVLIFNQNIAIISILVLSLSDTASALIGIKYGVTKLFAKSLEGTVAFFIITYFIIFIFSTASPILIFITATIVAFIELISTQRVNDNVLIPICTATILYLGGIY